VQAAVQFAAQRGMAVAVKANGHQVARAAHGAVLISTRRMNGVSIDAENRTARIEPGVRWGQVINETAEFDPERYNRLADVKKAYDPLNMFRMNHNITPA
jgi:FAD/FMN-containing dehydrogenase